MSIATKCMTANLSISVWTGHRLDKDASRRVTEDAGAALDAARVNKHLIPKDALKGIVAAQGALRTHFYTNTLPWKDNGDRLLTRKRYQPFIEEHERLKSKFDAAVTDFLDTTYLRARESAAFRMGEMFRADDYPSVAALRRRFQVVLDIDVVTEANDFRVQIDTEAQERVKEVLEASMRHRLEQATKDAWERLADAVARMVERLGTKDAVFRNSMLENIAEVAAILPDLNVTDDPDLNRLCAIVRDQLVGHDPAVLRTDMDERARVAAAAQSIYDEIGGLMRAFGSTQD
jgi:hypothetical protein